MRKLLEKGSLRDFVLRMIVTVTLLLTGGLAVAGAATIDFETATPGFSSLSSSPYTENGFTVTAKSGTWGIPSGSNRYAEDQSLSISEIDVTGTGSFTFSSIDLEQTGNGIDYSITGLLGGSTVLSLSGLFPSHQWGTIVNTTAPSQLIDTLKITADYTPAYIDNIVLNGASGTPEPGTVALIGCGLAALGLARFRRFRASL